MFHLKVAHCEDLNYVTIASFHSMNEAMDELESPSFAVRELMLCRIHNHQESVDAVYSEGQWTRIDRKNPVWNQSAYKLSYKSIISAYQCEMRPVYLMHLFQMFLLDDQLLKLCCDCLLYAYKTIDPAQLCIIRDDCSRIIHRSMKVHSLGLPYRVCVVFDELMNNLRLITHGNHRDYGRVISRIMYCNPPIENHDLSSFMRTIITPSILLRAVISHV